jgi:hypothetical protein
MLTFENFSQAKTMNKFAEMSSNVPPSVRYEFVCERVYTRAHTRTHARTHAHTHTRTHARTHAHTHTYRGRVGSHIHVCISLFVLFRKFLQKKQDKVEAKEAALHVPSARPRVHHDTKVERLVCIHVCVNAGVCCVVGWV